MAESFENLDTILRDWAKDKVQKNLVKALKRYEKQKKNDKAIFFRKRLRKITRAFSVGNRARLNKPRTIALSRI